MFRRRFLQIVVCSVGSGALASLGCRGRQFAHVLDDEQANMVGSHSAGAETFTPLVADAVSQLLARHAMPVHPVSHTPMEMPPGPKRICFVGVENKSAEDLGDFREQIYQEIDSQILQSQVFQPISRRFVEAGLRECRLRPDSLFIPSNMELFTISMQQMGQPFDYLLYATLTSGTTESNQSYQRDYLLTLEMINVHTGYSDKQSAKIRKGYHKTRLGAVKHYNPFRRE